MSFVVTAVVAAVELGTVAAIATAVTQVGIAMTVVGTVTKSKELTKIGGILSLAGGVTSLANAAYGAATGAAGAAGGTAASAASTAGELGQDSLWADLSNQAVADINANAAAGEIGNIAVDSFAGGATADATASLASGEGIGSFGDKLGSVVNDATAKAGDSLASTAADTAGKATADSGLLNLGTESASSVGDVAAGTAPANANALQSTDFLNGVNKSPGLGESIKDWYTKLTPDGKARVNTSILQAGGSAIGGLFNGWSADQRLALEKEVKAEEQRRYDTGVKNANAVPAITYRRGLVAGATGGQ